MPTLPLSLPPASDPEARLALAKEAFATYRTQCFWYLAPDLEVTLETLPTIVAGLREYGDRQAFLMAARLCQ